MRIGSRVIGEGRPCFVIAEAGVNHNGELRRASELVAAAASAGADAVKFQTFEVDALVASDAPKAAYQERQTGGGTQADMLRSLELAPDAFGVLAAEAAARGLLFSSTPFDLRSADLLNGLNLPFIKIGSGDLTHVTLLRHVARFGRPVVLSTGMATVEEVDRAVEEMQRAGVSELALLHCVSQYPAPAEDTNLAAMATLRARYGLAVGLSDHSVGVEIALAAVALGASLLEKHLTTDRSLPGPDHAASLTPDEFGAMVRQVRAVEAALGDGIKQPRRSEMELRHIARRGLYAAQALEKGTALTLSMLRSLRPASGIGADAIDQVIGRRTTRALAPGEGLRWEDLA